MTLTITVHRGTQTIGGSCIEIAAEAGGRLVLDVGRPLDAPRDAVGLLPATLDLTAPATVLISHPHMDHWGLIGELPEAWPIWTGRRSAELMRLTSALFGTGISRPIETWHSRSRAMQISGFRVTPVLTDHSAFDAYMLLIEAEGKRLLYTGDFRDHGRKSVLVDRLKALPPENLDVLLMEGTNLQSEKPVTTEGDLEQQFVDLAQATKGHVFVNWSAQNIDRTVTLYRAAKRSGRKLVVDLYTADVLERVAPGTRVPRPCASFDSLSVVITPRLRRFYQGQGRQDFVDRMAKTGPGTSRRTLAGGRAIIMHRDALGRDYLAGGLGFRDSDAYVFSNWSGYLDAAKPDSGWAQASAAGARVMKVHSSGHAGATRLAAFAAAMAPRWVVPVHGIHWDNPGIGLPPVRRLADGERWMID